MEKMFYYCYSLKSINLSSFNIINFKNFNYIFYGCSSLKKENILIKNLEFKLLNELTLTELLGEGEHGKVYLTFKKGVLKKIRYKGYKKI